MELQDLVRAWFGKWEIGNFRGIPVEDRFSYVSPSRMVHEKKHLSYYDLGEDAE